MRRLLTSILLFCVFMQQPIAQSISITTDGSQPVPGAMLDIKSLNKGLLIPRIALTGNNDVATLPDRPVSLLIYNTATVAGTNAVNPGYYYWDGVVWAKLISSGTSSPNDNTAIGFNALRNNAGTNNTAFGANALAVNTTGSFNTAVGFDALLSNTSGRKNTALGHDALAQNTFGQGNVALGTAAMFSNFGGINSVAVGEESLRNNTSGGQNTAIGHFSLYTNVTGINNTTVGAFADLQAGNLDNATAIGANSKVGCSNCFVLGSISAFNPVKVGIGYATPEYPLTFRSTVGDKISLYGTTGSHYGFGIQGGLLQVYTDGATSDIAFGYGQSSPLVENIRMKGNGDLQLGISNANATLIFGQSLAKKIVFFQGGTGQVGMGVFPGELRMYGDYPGASITFGNDNTTTGFSENMRIDGNGDLRVRNRVFANGIQLTSDCRLKKDISIIEDGLEKITQLNGYHYTWTDPQQDQSLQSGVLAQEVQQLFPELVKTDEKGYLSVNYVGLVPYLIQSVKEQQKQIDKMSKQLEELEKLVNKNK